MAAYGQEMVMMYNEVSADWVSNGRVLPTSEERDQMVQTIRLAAEKIASRHNNTEDLEDAISCEIIANSEAYGWDEADAKRVLRDALVNVH